MDKAGRVHLQAAGITAQAGRLAAQFARNTAERFVHARPSAAAWEKRLALRRGIAESMPHLTAALDRLRDRSRPRNMRRIAASAVGSAADHVPMPRPRHIFSPAQRPPSFVHRAALLSRRDSIPAMKPDAPAFARSSGAHSAKPAREAASLSSMPPGEMMLRHLPPSALREKLVRQSGLGESPAISLRQTLVPHLKFDPVIARLHRGAAAASAARELNAEAFTIGPDIFFAAGRYAPQTRAGLGLLAHELTHVGQQAARVGDKMRFFTPQGGDDLEGEAQQTAARVLEAEDREKTSRTGGALHQTSAPPRPALAFALSPAQSVGVGSTPAQKATEESGQPGAKVDPSQADARAVADRVYQIMKQEIASGRERGASRRRV